MGTLDLNYEKEKSSDGYQYECLHQKEIGMFNPKILELGNVSKKADYQEGLAAIFDLHGFTDFCNQIDPHLVIPEYLSLFLHWLFKDLSKEFVQEKQGDKVLLWSRLPFYSKFLGDGILFLWNTKDMPRSDFGSLIVTLYEICKSYSKNFYPKVEKKVAKPPQKLRCGIARGQIISIGDGRDFVGACINVAARLQNLGDLSFAFSRRGLDLQRCFHEDWQEIFVLARVAIRGIGEKELVYILKEEYEKLLPEQKDLFEV